MVPVNFPSIRTVPSKVSLPSNSEPRPSRAFRSPGLAGVEVRSSRFSMAMGSAPRTGGLGGGVPPVRPGPGRRRVSRGLFQKGIPPRWGEPTPAGAAGRGTNPLTTHRSWRVFRRARRARCTRPRAGPATCGLGDDPAARPQPALQARGRAPGSPEFRRGPAPGRFFLRLRELPDERLGRPDGQPLAEHALGRPSDGRPPPRAPRSARAWPMSSCPSRTRSRTSLGELEQAERVRDRGAVLADPLRATASCVRPCSSMSTLVGLGLLDRVQVGALEVLDERELEGLAGRSPRGRPGTSVRPARCAARQRRSPATIRYSPPSAPDEDAARSRRARGSTRRARRASPRRSACAAARGSARSPRSGRERSARPGTAATPGAGGAARVREEAPPARGRGPAGACPAMRHRLRRALRRACRARFDDLARELEVALAALRRRRRRAGWACRGVGASESRTLRGMTVSKTCSSKCLRISSRDLVREVVGASNMVRTIPSTSSSGFAPPCTSSMVLQHVGEPLEREVLALHAGRRRPAAATSAFSVRSPSDGGQSMTTYSYSRRDRRDRPREPAARGPRRSASSSSAPTRCGEAGDEVEELELGLPDHVLRAAGRRASTS